MDKMSIRKILVLKRVFRDGTKNNLNKMSTAKSEYVL